ncbi:MAG: prepilin peptidase [Clostridia bacterium]|nr:prepilin peptidase [Clostridia bacterium]
MYFNDIHIMYYVAIAIIGGIIGQFVDYCNRCFIKEQKIFSKESILKYKRIVLPNYWLILITAIGYVCLLYKFGLNNTIGGNLNLIKYIILLPMLECAFIVDLKEQIIPNRLNLLMFEIGLVTVFIHGFTNINIATNMLLGMFAGAGIFILITLIGGLIAGKEAMGMGDVKLMGALGLYFGLQSIVAISVLAFLIGAIGSIIYMVVKRKGADNYIPFGPFIVISSLISIFVPFSLLFTILMKIFSLGLYN